MLVRLMWVLIIIITSMGCGKIENQFTKVVSSEELVETHLFCSTLLGIPIFCSFEENRLIYVHVETVITKIVDITVIEEVKKEVIVEKIVTEFVTIYVSTEVDLAELVTEIVSKVKELVSEDELIDVPLNDIVDEITREFIDKLEE